MALSREALEARRAYQREWRKKNPGKTKEYNDRYWEKQAAEAAALEDEREAAEAAALEDPQGQQVTED